MRTLRRSTFLLLLPLAAGCSATRFANSGISPKMRTAASVGDRPLSVVAGEPGSSVVAGAEEPVRPLNTEGRISGRVVDAQGDPVPEARVRLAVGGKSKGKDISTTTDRSGAFTLSGLRPGESYTVVAEWGEGNEAMTGRARAHAPEKGIKISLGLEDEGASRVAGSKRVSPVSRRGLEEEDEEGRPEESRPRLNREDVAPPAPEAEPEAISSTRSRRRAAPEPAGSEVATPKARGWHKSGSPDGRGPAESGTEEDRDEVAAPPARRAAKPPARRKSEPADDQSPDDDGENPLPPALERGTSFAPAAASSDRAIARASSARAPGQPDRHLARSFDRFDPGPTPGWIDPNAPAPDPAADRPIGDEAPHAPAERPRGRVARAERGESPRRGRKTWEDLDSTVKETSLRRVAHEEPTSRLGFEAPAPAGTPRLAPVDDSSVRTHLGKGTSRRERQTVTYCRYDARHRQVIDFQLPDLAGRPVRFQDLDADFILLDFWGSWCEPCRKSIPHLVELQKAAGAGRLQVVGIACEQGPTAARAGKVAKAVESFGIDYPVLMSGMDGATCPVQQAFQVHAYPTMILLDRQGRVLWRDTGSTPVTLARLDRFLATAGKGGAGRVY